MRVFCTSTDIAAGSGLQVTLWAGKPLARQWVNWHIVLRMGKGLGKPCAKVWGKQVGEWARGVLKMGGGEQSAGDAQSKQNTACNKDQYIL